MFGRMRQLGSDRWIINGMKTFITSGRSASVAVLLAVTDPTAGKRGISAFLTRTDRPGYRVVRVEDKLGHRSNDTCQIALEDLQVSRDDMLGAPGQGLKIALAYLDTGRIGVAAQAVGVARAALDAAVVYARERETFGKKLVEHQAIALMLPTWPPTWRSRAR
jgi:butyryl-CoA dehydrogenase